MTAKKTETTVATKPAVTLTSVRAEIEKREAERVAMIAAKNKSGAKYARHCLRRARALLADLQAKQSAKPKSTPKTKSKPAVETPAAQ